MDANNRAEALESKLVAAGQHGPGHQGSGEQGAGKQGSGEQGQPGQFGSGQQGSGEQGSGERGPDPESGGEEGSSEKHEESQGHQAPVHQESDPKDGSSAESTHQPPPPPAPQDPETKVDEQGSSTASQTPPQSLESGQNLTETQVKALLSHLDVIELVDVADKMPELLPTIAYDFIREKYYLHDKLITIEGGSPGISFDDDHSATISGSEFIQKFLKLFGTHVSKLRINANHFDRPQALDVYNAVGEYCWELLKHMELNGVFINPFEMFHGKFPAVQELVIENVYGGIDTMEIHTIFPNVEKFHLQVYSAANLSLIAHKFPRLEKFKLRSTQLLEANPHFTQFLIENPQLYSLDLDSFDKFELLHVVDGYLPYLRKLHLQSPPTNFFAPENCEQKLRFGKVDEFSIRLSRDEHFNAECIPFDLPEMCRIEVTAKRLSDQWIEFFGQHKELGSISLPETELTYDELTKITRNGPMVRSIAVQWSEKPFGQQPIDGIVRFMSEVPELSTVVVWSDKAADSRSVFQAAGRMWEPAERKIVGNRSVVTYVKKGRKTSWFNPK